MAEKWASKCYISLIFFKLNCVKTMNFIVHISHFRANFNWIHKWAPRFSYQRCIKMVSRISGQKFCYFSRSWKTPFGHFWWKSQYLCRKTIWETKSQIFNKCCCGQRSVNFKMYFWCHYFDLKTNENFLRISALASKKRSKQKNEGTLLH